MNRKNISIICGMLVVVMLQLSLFIQSVNGAVKAAVPKLRFEVQYPTDATGGLNDTLPVVWKSVVWPQAGQPPLTGGVVDVKVGVSLPQNCQLWGLNPGDLTVEYNDCDGVPSQVKSKGGQWEKTEGGDGYHISVGTLRFMDGGCSFTLAGAKVVYTDQNRKIVSYDFDKDLNGKPMTLKINNKNLDLFGIDGVSYYEKPKSGNLGQPIILPTQFVQCGYDTKASFTYGFFDVFNPKDPGTRSSTSKVITLLSGRRMMNLSMGLGRLFDNLKPGFYDPYVCGSTKNRNLSISPTLGEPMNPDYMSTISDVQLGCLNDLKNIAYIQKKQYGTYDIKFIFALTSNRNDSYTAETITIRLVNKYDGLMLAKWKINRSGGNEIIVSDNISVSNELNNISVSNELFKIVPNRNAVPIWLDRQLVKISCDYIFSDYVLGKNIKNLGLIVTVDDPLPYRNAVSKKVGAGENERDVWTSGRHSRAVGFHMIDDEAGKIDQILRTKRLEVGLDSFWFATNQEGPPQLNN